MRTTNKAMQNRTTIEPALIKNMEQEQDFTLDQIIEQSFDFSDYSETEKEELIAETAAMIMKFTHTRVSQLQIFTLLSS